MTAKENTERIMKAEDETEKDTKDIPKDCADVDSLDSVNREQNSKQRR